MTSHAGFVFLLCLTYAYLFLNEYHFQNDLQCVTVTSVLNERYSILTHTLLLKVSQKTNDTSVLSLFL